MYYACMVALQIRDVPVAVRDQLAELARARGQSVQAYLLALVTRDAQRAHNLALLKDFADRADGTRIEPTADVALEIHLEREARTDHLVRVLGDTAL